VILLNIAHHAAPGYLLRGIIYVAIDLLLFSCPVPSLLPGIIRGSTHPTWRSGHLKVLYQPFESHFCPDWSETVYWEPVGKPCRICSSPKVLFFYTSCFYFVEIDLGVFCGQGGDQGDMISIQVCDEKIGFFRSTSSSARS